MEARRGGPQSPGWWHNLGRYALYGSLTRVSEKKILAIFTKEREKLVRIVKKGSIQLPGLKRRRDAMRREPDKLRLGLRSGTWSIDVF